MRPGISSGKKSSAKVQDRPYSISEKVITNSISETGIKNIVTKKTKEVRKNEKAEKIDFSTGGYGGFCWLRSVFPGTDLNSACSDE